MAAFLIQTPAKQVPDARPSLLTNKTELSSNQLLGIFVQPIGTVTRSVSHFREELMPFRKFIESRNQAYQQCRRAIGDYETDAAIGDGDNNTPYNFDPNTSLHTHCWLCGFPFVQSDRVHCEHMLPLLRAVLFLGISLPSEESASASATARDKNYRYAHSACNVLKSDRLFIKWAHRTNRGSLPQVEIDEDVVDSYVNKLLRSLSVYVDTHDRNMGYRRLAHDTTFSGRNRDINRAIYKGQLCAHFAVYMQPIIDKINTDIRNKETIREYLKERFQFVRQQLIGPMQSFFTHTERQDFQHRFRLIEDEEIDTSLDTYIQDEIEFVPSAPVKRRQPNKRSREPYGLLPTTLFGSPQKKRTRGGGRKYAHKHKRTKKRRQHVY